MNPFTSQITRLSRNCKHNFLILSSKALVCKEFGGLDEAKHTLFRLNAHEEPAFPLRRDNVELAKCHVASGDELMLVSNMETKPEDKLLVNIHLTMTGQPDDSQFLECIDVSQQYTLRDLKDVVLSLKQLEFAKDFVSIVLLLTMAASRASESQIEAAKHVLRENSPGPYWGIDSKTTENWQ